MEETISSQNDTIKVEKTELGVWVLDTDNKYIFLNWAEVSDLLDRLAEI